ncbi:hypothetical protein [Streptomyces sp. NPDC059134]|uniref:hypothetical protein n=1 Tax=Streptomyces sp. NPDC059134 TaxID=3346738 RepID=UPI0036B8DDD1
MRSNVTLLSDHSVVIAGIRSIVEQASDQYRSAPTRSVVVYIEDRAEGETSSSLLELAENQEAGTAVRHLGEGFDTLFRRLGPPPDMTTELEPSVRGDGGTER